MIGQPYNPFHFIVTQRSPQILHPPVQFQTRYGPALSMMQFNRIVSGPPAETTAHNQPALCSSGNCPSSRSCYSGCGEPSNQPAPFSAIVRNPLVRIFTGRAIQTNSGIFGRSAGALNVRNTPHR